MIEAELGKEEMEQIEEMYNGMINDHQVHVMAQVFAKILKVSFGKGFHKGLCFGIAVGSVTAIANTLAMDMEEQRHSN